MDLESNWSSARDHIFPFSRGRIGRLNSLARALYYSMEELVHRIEYVLVLNLLHFNCLIHILNYFDQYLSSRCHLEFRDFKFSYELLGGTVDNTFSSKPHTSTALNDITAQSLPGLCMASLVVTIVSFRSERTRTDQAFIGFFPSMDPHMNI